MKKSLFAAALFAASLGFASFAAHAEGECDRYKNAYDQTYCFAKLFLESDKELNQVYTDLMGAIKPGARARLKETELAWIRYRNEKCAVGGRIDVDCNYRVNRERTEYLRDRLRECKTGTCREEEIGRPSWD